MTLLGAGMISGAAYGANSGNPVILAEQRAFEARVEVLVQEMKNQLTAGTAAIQGDISAQTTALKADNAQQTADINAFTDLIIYNTHLVNPLDVAVSICADIGNGAEYSGEFGVAFDIGVNGEAGISALGNGFTFNGGLNAELGGAAGIGADVGVSIEACINGIIVRQVGTTDTVWGDTVNTATIPTLTADQAEFVARLTETGEDYLDRVVIEAEYANLYDPDLPTTYDPALLSSLDALEDARTLIATAAADPQGTVAGIIEGGSNSPLAPLFSHLPLGDQSAGGVLTEFVCSALPGGSGTGTLGAISVACSAVGDLVDNVSNDPISAIGCVLGSAAGCSSWF
jgi:hypothetical protein